MDPYKPIFKLSARSISNKIRLWAKKAGVDLNAHSLRHYYATQLYYYSKDIQAVQMQLGHKSIATTERYLGLSQQRIQDAVDKLCLAGEEEEEAPPSDENRDVRLVARMPGNPRLKELGPKVDKVFGPRIK